MAVSMTNATLWERDFKSAYNRIAYGVKFQMCHVRRAFALEVLALLYPVFYPDAPYQPTSDLTNWLDIATLDE